MGIANALNNFFLGNTTGAAQTAGQIGESIPFDILSTAAVAVTNGTAMNWYTFLNLNGVFELTGNCTLVNNNGSVSYADVWFSLTSATQPDPNKYMQSTSIGTANNNGLTIPSRIFTLSPAQNVYVSVIAGYSGTTLSICGQGYAKRIR